MLAARGDTRNEPSLSSVHPDSSKGTTAGGPSPFASTQPSPLGSNAHRGAAGGCSGVGLRGAPTPARQQVPVRRSRGPPAARGHCQCRRGLRSDFGSERESAPPPTSAGRGPRPPARTVAEAADEETSSRHETPAGGQKRNARKGIRAPCRYQGRFGFCLREDDAPPGRPSPRTARPPQAGAPAQSDPHSRSRCPRSAEGEEGRMCRDTATGSVPPAAFPRPLYSPSPPGKTLRTK